MEKINSEKFLKDDVKEIIFKSLYDIARAIKLSTDIEKRDKDNIIYLNPGELTHYVTIIDSDGRSYKSHENKQYIIYNDEEVILEEEYKVPKDFKLLDGIENIEFDNPKQKIKK